MTDDTDNDQAGWKAGLRLCFAPQDGVTRLVRKKQYGPLTVQRPFYPEHNVCHIYLLHPPGGVVGGDRLNLELNLGKQAHSLVTTPGAGKFYRSAGQTAALQQRFEIADAGILEWLPQETILFEDTRAQLHSHIELHGSARYLGWEIVCLGRPAAGEGFELGQANISFSLYRDRKPLLLERLELKPGQIERPAGLRGHTVSATLLATGADTACLQALRELLPEQGPIQAGASLIEDLLVVRCLGYDGEEIKKLMEQAWRTLRPMTLGLPPATPRIWAT